LAIDLSTSNAGPGAPVSPDASEYLTEVLAALSQSPFVFRERDALKLVEPTLARLKAAPAEVRLAFVLEAMRAMRGSPSSLKLLFALKGMAASLLRKDLPLSAGNALEMVQLAAQPRLMFPYRALLTALEPVPLTLELREALHCLRNSITEWHGAGEMRDLHERIDTLLTGGKKSTEAPLAPAGAWSDVVFRETAASANTFAWRTFFLHARSLTQSTAPKKWQAEAVSRIEAIGRAEFLDSARRWLALGPVTNEPTGQTADAEADYQKGLIWAMGALGDTSVAPNIADFALACFRKIPMIGAVSHRVGNACVNALATMPGLAAVFQLSRLAAKVKYDVARRLIEKALAEAAARNGVSRDDLEAMSVPTFGLDSLGVRVEAAGDCAATLYIEEGGAVLQWSRNGSRLKSVPADVKDNHSELAAELKKAAKELDAILATQRFRLERQLLSQNACAFAHWREWYIAHPVVSHFARRLIWEVETADTPRTAVWRDGRLMDWAGNGIEPEPGTPIRLWHPIRSDVQSVLSWRCWLEDNGVTQPFKQAHREVYILTDAERQSATFSNRFAAHIVRQHQFSALCRERGWQFNLMGAWDSHNTPYLELPQHGLRAEFDVDFPSEADESRTTAHAVYLVIRTGQVRFKPLTGKTSRQALFKALQEPGGLALLHPATLPLEGVLAVVFSEVMRDCDLFVGVTSIGADPAWPDNHPDDPHLDYWREFAGAELSAEAGDRSSILERLLPKLAIRDRCRLEGRYLEVQGDLHRYRIHLGSGNVLMEPGSRYLCIVQGAGDKTARVALPFEGDRMLSLILSKAFLLADDKSIKDPSIKRQL
jgi:hypothetical protein